METKDAWLKMIHTKGIEKDIGITESTRKWFHSRAKKHNEYPSFGTMMRHLRKSGWEVIQDMLWREK
jgi:hypothetical protein